jgi:Patatin-like phospholipase
MLFTTATYDESHFMNILSNILEEKNMLDTRADPSVPLVCCLTSKMSSTPTHVALFRNYNYGEGELADPFVINPDQARDDLNLPLDIEHDIIKNGQYVRKVASKGSPGVRVTTSGSRHPGSFRVLQRYALRASTAAPTVFKPVMMGGEMYCDGGIVASNPTAVAIHEARAVFPNVPIELVVSVGTGNFLEEKSAPRIGWDGIIGQIVNSATDAEQIHHILEDVFGTPSLLNANTDKSSAVSSLLYCRFNPVIGRPDEFPIDVTDPEKLMKLRHVTKEYLNEPQQREKIDQIDVLFNGRKSWFKRFLLAN